MFVNAATGNLSPRTDTEFTYNPSTGELSTNKLTANNINCNTFGPSMTFNDSINNVATIKGAQDFAGSG